MRNSKNEPINPLLFYSNVIKDNIAPRIFELSLIPLNYKSLINLKTDSLFYDLERDYQYIFPDTLFFTGKIGLLLKVHDYANGANNRFSFNKAQMFVDNKIVYNIKYDSFSYTKTSLIELDKNFSLWRNGKGIYHNFFRHPANSLLRIVIEDFEGNHAEFQMNFVSGNPPHLQNPTLQKFDENYFIRFKSSEKIKNIKISPNDISSWMPLEKQKLYSELLLENYYYYTFSFKSDSLKINEFIELQGQTESGIPSFPIFLSIKTDNATNNAARFEISNYRIKKNWLEISTRVSPNYANSILPKLKTKLSDILYLPLQYDLYQIHFPIESLDTNIDIYEAMFGEKPPEYQLVHPNRSSKIESKDKLFSADFNQDAMYEETAIFLRTYELPKNLNSFHAPYRIVGSVYDIQPFDQPINQGVHISLTIPESERYTKGLGIYYWNKKKGWTFLSANLDSLKNQFRVNVTSLELFTLGQDTIPPILLPAQKIQNGVLESNNRILKFTLKDEKSGIRMESQINVYLNNHWYLFEYDPEENLLVVEIPKSTNRYDSLKVTVVDNAGNQLKKTFRVE
jgi:hypothetical protein